MNTHILTKVIGALLVPLTALAVAAEPAQEPTLKEIMQGLRDDVFVIADGMFTDDRPPKIQLDKIRTELQAKVEEIMAQYPDAVEPVTQESAEVKHWEGASEKANYDDEPVGVPSWLAPPENGVPEHYVLNPKNNRVYRVVPGARFESLRTGTKLRLTSVKHSLQPCTKEGVVL